MTKCVTCGKEKPSEITKWCDTCYDNRLIKEMGIEKFTKMKRAEEMAMKRLSKLF